MKIAVCMSGQVRTAVWAFDNIRRYIGDLWSRCDFYVHTWDVNTRKHYNKTHGGLPDKTVVSPEHIAKYQQLYNVPDHRFVVECLDHELELLNEKHRRWTPLLETWARSLDLMNKEVAETGCKYDYVIKLRPDIIFPSDRLLSAELLQALAGHDPETSFLVESLPVNWRDNGWINDVLWVSTPNTMNLALEAYRQHDQSETLGLYLESQGVVVRNLCDYTGYAILRFECLQYDPLTQYPECFLCETEYF